MNQFRFLRSHFISKVRLWLQESTQGDQRDLLPDKSQWILYLLSSSSYEGLIVGAIADNSACDETILIRSCTNEKALRLRYVASSKHSIACINIWDWKQTGATQLHYISHHAENRCKPAVYLAALCSEYAQPDIRSSEWDIKMCQLGCTSSRCVAIWQRVLICCVVCGALGQMCPLFCTAQRLQYLGSGGRGARICIY